MERTSCIEVLKRITAPSGQCHPSALQHHPWSFRGRTGRCIQLSNFSIFGFYLLLRNQVHFTDLLIPDRISFFVFPLLILISLCKVIQLACRPWRRLTTKKCVKVHLIALLPLCRYYFTTCIRGFPLYYLNIEILNRGIYLLSSS